MTWAAFAAPYQLQLALTICPTLPLFIEIESSVKLLLFTFTVTPAGIPPNPIYGVLPVCGSKAANECLKPLILLFKIVISY